MSIIIQADRRYAGFWLRRGMGVTLCLGWLSVSVYRVDIVQTIVAMGEYIEALEAQ